MKTNSYLKKLIAFVCVISLLVNSMWLQSFAETTSESGETTETTYTELTFSDYGFTNGVVYENPKKNTYNQLRADNFSSMASLDGVAFTGKVLFSGAIDPNYGIRAGWGGSGKAGIGVYREGTQLKFWNFTTGKALDGVWSNSDGINLDTAAVTVRYTFDYAENDSTTLKFTVSINGETCVTDTVAAAKLGTGILVYPAAAADEIASVEPTFKEVTFSDYGISDGVVSQDSLYDATTGQIKIESHGTIESMAGVALTGKIHFPISQGSDGNYGIRVGFRNGIGITREGTDLVIYHYLRGPATKLQTVPATTHGVDLNTTAVTIRFAFQYVNETDFICTVSINGTKYVMQYFPNLLSGLGTGMLIWPKDNGIAVESVATENPDEPQEPQEPEEEPQEPEKKYKEVTFYDYGIADSKTEVGKGTHGNGQTIGTITTITNLDGVAFSGNVLLEDTTDAPQYNGVRIGFGSGANQGGIGVCRAGTGILLYNYTNNTVKGFTGVYNHGVTDLDTTAITIRFAFNYVEGTTDVDFTFSINGTKYYEGTITDGQTLLGKQILIWARTASVTVESVGDFEMDIPELSAVEDFTKITFASYGLESGTYGHSNGVNGYCKLDSMDKVVFSDVVNFSEEPYAQLRIGGKASPWEGVILNSLGNGNLRLTNTAAAGFAPITFDATVAGMDLVGQDVMLTMSFEYVDCDEDGAVDDVKLGVWFNGKAYANRWIYLQDKAEELGGFILIYCPNEKTSLTITTYIPSVEFRAYGFTENWEVELGLKREQ